MGNKKWEVESFVPPKSDVELTSNGALGKDKIPGTGNEVKIGEKKKTNWSFDITQDTICSCGRDRELLEAR